MAWKLNKTLGRQAIPNFARNATLCEGSRCFTDGDGNDQWPEPSSIYNIAALGFFRRAGVLQEAAGAAELPSGRQQPISVSYWSNNAANGTLLRFGLDNTAVPGGAEWFSVAWLRPPDSAIGQIAFFPYPEDFFRVVWTLSQ